MCFQDVGRPRLGLHIMSWRVPTASTRSLSEILSTTPSPPGLAGIRKQTELTIGPWQQFPEAVLATRKGITLLLCLSLKWKCFSYIPFLPGLSVHILNSILRWILVSILGNVFSLTSAVYTGHYYVLCKHKRVISELVICTDAIL